MSAQTPHQLSAQEVVPRIDLFWIPLGADGSGLVRTTGRLYEWIKSRRERRDAVGLLHTALQVHVPEGRFVIETMWPSPRSDPESRGVVTRGDVGGLGFGLIPQLRYEIRCWREGDLTDRGAAVGGPQTITQTPRRPGDSSRRFERCPG